MCDVVLAVAVLATGTGIPGCGNPGEGTVTVDPKVRARLGKGPDSPAAAARKSMVQSPGIKPRPRSATGVK
jgi:hypothetical protein